jgi:hypothetical protein
VVKIQPPPRKKHVVCMHAKLLLFDSWLIGVGTPSTPWQLLGGKATLHQERNMNVYMKKENMNI